MLNKLRKLRFQRSIPQILLSQKTGISQSTLSKIEHNWIKGTPEQRRRIVAFFKARESAVFPPGAKSKNSNEKP